VKLKPAKRAYQLAALLSFAAGPLGAQPASAPPIIPSPASAPYEIVRSDIDLEAAPDGRSWEVKELHFRPLTSQGVEALQRATLSFTSGYEALAVRAYTLKKDGRRIDIPQNEMLQGHGDTSSPGFQDTHTLTVIYPDLEIGDQVVLITQKQQSVPWFPDVFADTQSFSRKVAVKEASIAFTSQGKDSAFHIHTNDVESDPPVSAGGKTRHVWHYHNDGALILEPEAVTEIADLPHVAITTQESWSDVGHLYADLFKDRAKTTPEITKLASDLTEGVRDRRQQARILYEWVAGHIRYVDIVLGAGGFLPHEAADVLKNGYGDCKDHVMLLEALLSAKGIKSSSVLIRAGVNLYKLPPAPSPFVFDHLITYIPEFSLFVDSTARYAPFGVLPTSDAGKEVLMVKDAKIAVTPAVTAANSSITAASTVTVNPDGSADAETRIVATGAEAVDMRGMMAALAPDRDGDFFRAALGPGSDGKFQRNLPEKLADTYEFSARYHTAHLANMPGPGALPAALAYKPFSFGRLVAQTLPQTRASDYACSSGTFRDDVTATLPASTSISIVPPTKSFTVEGAVLETSYENPATNVLKEHVVLKMDRQPVCRATDYARIRPGLTEMMGALFAQALYK